MEYLFANIHECSKEDAINMGLVCPYCDIPTEYHNSSLSVYKKDYGPIYKCPKCGAYVGTHKPHPTKALGRVADANLRKAKRSVHFWFDKIWRDGIIDRLEVDNPTGITNKRKKAYLWLSQQLGIDKKQTHIGMFDNETCWEAYQICKETVEGKMT